MPDVLADELMTKLEELEKRGFTLSRATSLPAEEVLG